MEKFCYEYPRPMVTVDIIITAMQDEEVFLLLIKRGNEPFKDMFALPGGFVDMHEDLHQAAMRELHEETGVSNNNLHQFKTYGTPNRDPRGRTISVVYYCDVLNSIPATIAGDDAAEAQWFNINNLPNMAFDHNMIMGDFINVHFNKKL
jgi:8-oxo-dGTP diphosphatase